MNKAAGMLFSSYEIIFMKRSINLAISFMKIDNSDTFVD